VLLGSARIKAACKILVKLTTGVNFTHIEIQIETTSSQKVCAASIITGDQGGEPTLCQFEMKLTFFI